MPSKWPEMRRRSQRTPCLQAEASQSGRPRSTSSTNSYSPSGRRCRKTSRSSAELTVTVQTVRFSARASMPPPKAKSATRRATRACTDKDRKCPGIPTIPPVGFGQGDYHRWAGRGGAAPPGAVAPRPGREGVLLGLQAAEQDVDHVVAAVRLQPVLTQHADHFGLREQLIVGANEDARYRALHVGRLGDGEKARELGQRLAILEPLLRQRIERPNLRG